MNANELRTKTVPELLQELRDLLREQFNLRIQKGIKQLNRHTQIRAIRRNVARVKTVLAEKGKKV